MHHINRRIKLHLIELKVKYTCIGWRWIWGCISTSNIRQNSWRLKFTQQIITIYQHFVFYIKKTSIIVQIYSGLLNKTVYILLWQDESRKTLIGYYVGCRPKGWKPTLSLTRFGEILFAAGIIGTEQQCVLSASSPNGATKLRHIFLKLKTL